MLNARQIEVGQPSLVYASGVAQLLFAAFAAERREYLHGLGAWRSPGAECDPAERSAAFLQL